MSLTARKFILLKKAVTRFLVPVSNVLFAATLVGIPFLYRLKYTTSVEEHGYLNRYSVNELVQADFDLMYNTKAYLLNDRAGVTPEKDTRAPHNHYNYHTRKNNYTDYEHEFGKRPRDGAYSYWSDERFEDTPEVFVRIAESLRQSRNIQVSYNRFKYTFPTRGKNAAVLGHNLLFKLNCMRCLARGATLLVATLNTDRFSEDITSALLSLTAMRHLATAQYLSQNIFLLVVMKQAPFAAGVRQFLHDYHNSHYFRHRSGTIHNGLVVDLGSNNCSSLLVSYEGIDGLLPNQDIVNIFVEIADMEGMAVSVRGFWQSLFRMAVNVDRNRQHVPMLERNINAFSVVCKATAKADQRAATTAELLLKSLVLTLRNQNNLHTALERSFNFYYFVTPTTFVSISVYALVLPLLFVRQIAWLLFYTVFDNLKMALGVALVFANMLVASLPSYLFLLNLVRRNSGNAVGPELLDEVRKALGLLVVAYLLVFTANVALYRKFADKFGDDYFAQGESLVKEDIVARIDKLKNRDRPRRLDRLRAKLRALRARVTGRPAEAAPETARTEGSDMELASARDAELYAELERLMALNRAMGHYWYINQLPKRLPRADTFLLFSLLFLTLACLMGLSVLNWALCFLLTLVVLVPFSLASPERQSRWRSWASAAYFAALALLFYPFGGLMGRVRRAAFGALRLGSRGLRRALETPPLRNVDLLRDLGRHFGFLEDFVFGERTHWINSRADCFLLRKVYSASENHLLLGSYNVVFLLFAFGVVAHMLFLNVVALSARPEKAKQD